jgi:hypothetical protein
MMPKRTFDSTALSSQNSFRDYSDRFGVSQGIIQSLLRTCSRSFIHEVLDCAQRGARPENSETLIELQGNKEIHEGRHTVKRWCLPSRGAYLLRREQSSGPATRRANRTQRALTMEQKDMA